jgi:hypothetical protein
VLGKLTFSVGQADNVAGMVDMRDGSSACQVSLGRGSFGFGFNQVSRRRHCSPAVCVCVVCRRAASVERDGCLRELAL